MISVRRRDPRGPKSKGAKRGSPAVRPAYGYVFVAPFFIIFAVFQLYPILYSFYLSFTNWDGFSAPVYIGLDNYRRLIDDPFFSSH